MWAEQKWENFEFWTKMGETSLGNAFDIKFNSHKYAVSLYLGFNFYFFKGSNAFLSCSLQFFLFKSKVPSFAQMLGVVLRIFSDSSM